MPPEGIPRQPKPGEIDGLQPAIKAYSDEMGLKMKRSPFMPSTRLALEAGEYAREMGKFDEFHLAVFKAYWQECKNIGLKPVLKEVAEQVGLDADEMERRLDEGRYKKLVKEQSQGAKNSGVNGIPAYIIGGYLVEGVQPYEYFKQIADMVLRKEQE